MRGIKAGHNSREDVHGVMRSQDVESPFPEADLSGVGGVSDALVIQHNLKRTLLEL